MTDRRDKAQFGGRHGVEGPGLATSDRSLVLVLCLGLAVAYGFAAYSYYSSTAGLFDSSNHPIGRDFVNIWTASVLGLGGQALEIFDVSTFHPHQEQLLGRSFPTHIWSYPPHALLFVLPLGLVPYLLSYALWSVATLALYLVAALGGRWTNWGAVALVLAPATVVNFVVGQNGYLTAALLISGMRLIDSRPVLAGVLFGLLSFKPQLGLLIPVALVAARLWRPFVSAATTVVLLVALSVAVFGPEAWKLYHTQAGPLQRMLLEQGSGLFVYMMPTTFMSMRILGAEASTGYLVQAAVAFCVIPCIYGVFRKSADRNLQIAALIVATFLVTPYAFGYDLTALSVAVLWAFGHAVKTRFMPGEKLLLTVLWILPIAVMVINQTGLPIAPLFLAAFLVVLLARIHGWAPKPALTRPVPTGGL